MAFQREEFIAYLIDAGIINPGAYCALLNNIEQILKVDIDEEFSKDECVSLYNQLQELRKHPETIGKKDENIRNFVSKLNKYIEFKQGIKASNVKKFNGLATEDEEVKKTNADFKNKMLQLIAAYKKDFERIDKGERYKWEALKWYKDHWNIDAPDFAEMAKTAFAKASNLLTSGNYFAYRMLCQVAEAEPEKVRNLFKLLYDESKPLADRFDKFRAGFEEYCKPLKINHYQDLHAISVYLSFEQPEKYYIYKYGVWIDFVRNLGLKLEKISGKHETVKIEYSNNLCDKILSFIENDDELIAMSEARFGESCYRDPAHHVLAFDIIFFGSYYVFRNNEEDWWPSLEEFNPNLTKEDWIKYILEIENPNHPSPMQMLKAMVELGGEASCKKISDVYGGTPYRYVGCTMNLGRRIKKYFNLPACMDGDQERYFPFPFVGKKGLDGDYVYKLRPELFEALKEIDLTDVSPYYTGEDDEDMSLTDVKKNTILYGPPGTGKTYNTVCYAVAVVENKPIEDIMAEAEEDGGYYEVFNRYNEYKNQGLIEFTTFHQSYGYEEFIEGIKPVIGDKDEIQYKVESGLFKKFCEKVGGNKSFDEAWEALLEATRENDNRYIFTRRTGTKISVEFRDENSFVVKWNGPTQTKNILSKTNIKKQWEENNYSQREALIGGTKWLFDANQAVIDELIAKYELMTEGTDNTHNNYVFIIDEINRGNISKIFGELITLIEPSKRDGEKEGLKAALPYSKKLFGIPENVYILGTMNTADRSIALLDTALRRRFDFVEMMPDAEILNEVVVDGIEISKMLAKMNERIAVLFDREHTIGHAYFIDLKNSSNMKTLADIFKNKIIPLLQEYFYEDYERIRLVLADNQVEKTETEKQFILAENVDASALFGSSDIDIFDDTKRYVINNDAFENKEAYIKIY